MARLSDLSPRFIGADPGPGLPKVFDAGIVFHWPTNRGEEVCVRFGTALDGSTVPPKRRGTDERRQRTGTDFETLTLATPVRFSGGTLTITNGEVLDAGGAAPGRDRG